MSSNVKVSGIPSHVKIAKLVPLFSDILSMRSSDFVMRILSTKGPVNDILLILPSCHDAQLALEKLDNFVYKYNSITYIFSAELYGGYINQNNSKAKPKLKNQHRSSYGTHQGEYHQDRSSSPRYQEKSSQLDLHLEILKKKRMILEEERKLLEEQKKLDELRMSSFNSDTSLVDTTCDEDVESCELSSNSSIKKSIISPPTFLKASKLLIKQMAVFINTPSSISVRGLFLKEIRAILKQRLTMVVAEEGRDTYQTQKVLKLYRAKYPEENDEEFVNQVLKDVKKCLEVNEPETDQVPGTATNDNKPESVAEDHELQKGMMTAKDTTLAGNSDDYQFTRHKGEKFERNRLYFHKSSEALLRKMNTCVKKLCPPEKHIMLKEYLRFSLKQRLAAVVDGQPIYQTKKILNMYRDQHPLESDEDFINQLLKEIEEGNVPEDVMIKVKVEQKKKERAANAQKKEESCAINNQIPLSQIPSAEVYYFTDTSGQVESEEGLDISGSAEYEEKSNDDNVSQPPMENQNQEDNKEEENNETDNKEESNTEEWKIEDNNEKSDIDSSHNKEKSNMEENNKEETNLENSCVVNVVKDNGNMENNSSNAFVTDKIEEGEEKFDTDDFVGDYFEINLLPSEASQNYSDEVKVDKESYGVKRTADDDKNNCPKVAKIDDGTLIISDDENELENY